ncbi:MAG: hypothetical protein RBR67_14220 [Desulfobacterium sp.]|jgi:hypothetical protein|nr:hypothetical protein [Desulfobacterium sp.]
MKHGSCDRLGTSRYGLAVITLVSVIALVVMTVITIHSHGDSRQTTQMWITCLALHTPAVLPSGHVLRNDGYSGPAIDQRHTPYLPLMDFSLESMMVGSLKPERGETH